MTEPLGIRACDISFSYGKDPVFFDFSASLTPGSLTAVIGPNGCGKTTLLKCFAGLQTPAKGQILFSDGTDLARCRRRDAALRISYLPQLRTVPDIPVSVLVGHGRFPHLSFSRKLTKHDREIIGRAMAQAGIAPLAHKSMPQLSGGEQQRAYLAMLLAQDTPILLLDEPTNHLDAGHRFETMELLRSLQRCRKTIGVVLHDLPLALEYADRILLLDHGKVVFSGTPEQAYTSGAVADTFGIRLQQVMADGRPHYMELSRQN